MAESREQKTGDRRQGTRAKAADGKTSVRARLLTSDL
jgi:hypothetical protein